jgi:hypothetical protein
MSSTESNSFSVLGFLITMKKTKEYVIQVLVSFLMYNTNPIKVFSIIQSCCV